MKQDWIIVHERLSMTNNQTPAFPSVSFENWVNEGWEVVSITPINMEFAIGVLRRRTGSVEQ